MKRTPIWLRALLGAAVAASLLATLPGPARGATFDVDIMDFAFAPADITVNVGDTVRWTNRDAVIHTATSVDGAFDSGDLEQGESYSLTFTAPGTYDYLCTPHPSMTGRVVVLAAAATPAPSGDLPNVAMPPSDPTHVTSTLVPLGMIVALGAIGLGIGRLVEVRASRVRPVRSQLGPSRQLHDERALDSVD